MNIGIMKPFALLFFSVVLFACSNDKKEVEQSNDDVVKARPAAKSAELSDSTFERDSNALYATLRKLDLASDKVPPSMAPQLNTDLKRVRNYPEQPPTIPHKIEFYQVDKNHNQCMDCHARANIAVSQAPMVSISHFMSRDGQFLASISARRYFCTQCHVAQLDVQSLVENEFVDVDAMVKVVERERNSQ